MRQVAHDEWPEYVGLLEQTFGEQVTLDDVQYWKDWADADAALAVYDGSRIVASCASRDILLSVPGGTCKMAALGLGQVLPTHTRRGILRGLLRRLHDRAREIGAGVVGGWPSEGGIHGRFGWAPATYSCSWNLATDSQVLASENELCGYVDLVPAERAGDELSAIYNAVRAETPGMTSRTSSDWKHWQSRDPWHWQGPELTTDVGNRTVALWRDRGYVVYRLQRRWEGGVPRHRLLIAELVAQDDTAYRGLIEFVARVDLVKTVVATQRPTDEPLALMLADARAMRTQLSDALWLRLVDVERCMNARRYSADGSVVFRVIDTWGEWATGTYELLVDDGRGVCRSTRGTPDVVLTVQALSAAYLGGTSVARLARAGAVSEERSGATTLLARMLASEPLPWCPSVF